MGLPQQLFFVSFLIFAAAIDGIQGDAMVTGTVFCDQCKDGQRSWFDYPISGVKVKVTCTDSNGQITMSREETTNWFGNYAVKFDGAPDLSGCFSQVSDSGQGSESGCSAPAGPAQKLRLMFRFFDMEMYATDSLLSQPAQPMPNCPKSTNPVPAPVTPAQPPPVAVPVPPAQQPPVATPAPPAQPQPVVSPVTPAIPPPSPAFRLPPMPPLPPLPPAPFLEASACPSKSWTMPEYRCYWRMVNPETKVAVVFGSLAASRYGTDLTMMQALQGRGDPYRTLLREGVTSFLNSYNTLRFPYNTIGVVQHMDWALMGSTRSVLLTGLRFMRANSGYGTVNCSFTPCK
uniref:Uncharacterized protein n=1 Tax=Cannabis sativa TaxID=3483 RepID=A0A803QT17_CANSA